MPATLSGVNRSKSTITLATKITVVRLLGVPVFIVMVMYYLASIRAGAIDDTYRLAALALFMVIALTDALDGYLARRRGEITRLGSILDPIADKALMLSGLILLTKPAIPDFEPRIPLWFTGLVISRDVFLVAGAFLIRFFAHEVHIKPHWTGKLSTLMQVLIIAWVLAQGGQATLNGIILLAGLFTAMSGAIYLRDGLRQLEHSHTTRPAR